MATNFSLIGVSFSYFSLFIQDCGGEEALRDLTTSEVCEKFVKLKTFDSKLSLCEQFRNKERTDIVGLSTWFISHAWQYKFLDVVEAIRIFLTKEYGDDRDNIIVWFDLFSNSQHNTGDKPFEWWTGTFTTAIKSIGNVLMIMIPWNDPITLTRAWCLFEILACETTKSRFDVSMTANEQTKFLSSMKSDYGAFYKMLAKINSQNSKSYLPKDKERIFDAVHQLVQGGFVRLDNMVLSVLEKWMVSVLQEKLTEVDGDDEEEQSGWKGTLASLYQDQGKYELAEPLFVSCLDTRKRVLGENHPSTLVSVNNLALLYRDQGKYELAEPLFVSCLDTSKRVLGENHPSTLASVNNLALLYRQQGKYELAEPLYVSCLDTRKRVLGENHPSTLASVNSLASLYQDQGKYELAEPLFVSCLDTSKRVLGENHPDTLIYVNNLALLYRDQGKYELVEPLFVSCLDTRKRVLGENHPSTLASVNNLRVCREKRVGKKCIKNLCSIQ
jgi:tetratricopeptide (TPR) repeat protein